MAAHLEQMIAALGAEAAAVREPRHRHRVTVTDGELRGEFEGQWLYQFEMPPRAVVDDHAAARGVRVEVVTKPGAERDGGAEAAAEESLEQLAAVGVQVHRRPYMHSKVVVIDGRIGWVGSRNILSHGGTTETMVRIPSPAIARALTRAVMDGAEAEPCPRKGCTGELVPRTGSRGPFMGCTRYPACRATKDVTSSGRGAPTR